MQKKHPTKPHLTRQERVELIHFLLRPCQHRGKLHHPKEAYITEEAGLTSLAQDVMYWLGHRSLRLKVIDSKAVVSGWHVELTEKEALISIDVKLREEQPFVAAYYTILGVLQVIVWRYSNIKLNTATNNQLLEHMSIEAGLGIYGINAAHQPQVHHIGHLHHSPSLDKLLSVTTATYLHWFINYVRQHNRPIDDYEDDLLPAARKSLKLPSLNHQSSNPLIAHTTKQLQQRRQLRILAFTVACFVLLLGWIAWEQLPKQLTAEQQQQLTTIAELESAYQICAGDLKNMVGSVSSPDILSSRSIQNKVTSCEKLRQEHNRLVRELRQARR